MKKTTTKFLFFAISVITCLVFTTSCKKLNIKQTTTEDVNMVGYLDKHLDSFSLFRQILDRTETSNYLNAYGHYTCFAPTNSGVRTYLSKLGVSSVENADLATLKDMVRLHLMEEPLVTGDFKDGKIPVITMLDQYLIASVEEYNGNARYLINRQAFILTPDVKVNNGIIHVLDNVLIAPQLTIAKTLEANSNYSIFVQALKETGYFALLDINNNPDTTKKWLTVLAESNRALQDSGITSYAQLKARYSKTGNPMAITDSLNLYCAYHILPGIKYLGDIVIAPSHTTLAPQEVVSARLDNLQVLINDDVFDGVLEPGVALNRSVSDIAATNGVIHDANAHFAQKIRKPTAVFWDVSDFNEIRRLPAFFRKQNFTFSRLSEADQPIKDINWNYISGASLVYTYSTTGSVTNFACYNDVNVMGLGAPGRPSIIDYRTPTIIKGRYKVWVCYRQQRGSGNSTIQSDILVDGVRLQRPFSFTETRPGGTDTELESIGWKRYTESTNVAYNGRLVGTVDILTTERHMLHILVTSGSNTTNNLDMIHFIPVNDNQILPRFRPNGDKTYF